MIVLQTRCVTFKHFPQKQSSKSSVCSRPIQALCRADSWQASPSSSSSPETSCLASSDSCQAGCCRRKPLPLAECSFSTSSLLQRSSRRRLVSAGLSRIATIVYTNSVLNLDSVDALPVERLIENAEFDECRDHADMSTVSEAIEIFATSNGSICFTAEGFASSNGASLLAGKVEEEDRDEDERLMPSTIKKHAKAYLQPLLDTKLLAEPVHVPYSSSLPFLGQDASPSVLEYEKHIIEKEKLRRKKISEANKNKIPWNKGKKYNQGKHRNSAAKKEINFLDSDAEIIAGEKQRRQRIAAANLGKVPWNKGRQHSEETRHRIRERTIEAMKNPKVREKLRVNASTLSNETKSKISASLELMWEAKKKLKQCQNNCEEEWKEYVADAARIGHGDEVEYVWSIVSVIRRYETKSKIIAGLELIWGAKKKLKQDQKNCEEEWKEYVADAARMGHGDEDEYDWSSYGTILNDLRKYWRSDCKRRTRNPRLPLTSAHRIKISNAIKKKWTDLSYRSSVEAAIQARRGKHGTDHLEVKRRCRTKEGILENEEFHNTVIRMPNADSMLGIGSELLQSIQKVQPAYRNPLSNEMLENLKRVRAKRRSKETSQSRALERARTLMVKAKMAARALEAQAETDENALPPLQEAQKLLAEAAESFKAAGLEGDFFLGT